MNGMELPSQDARQGSQLVSHLWTLLRAEAPKSPDDPWELLRLMEEGLAKGMPGGFGDDASTNAGMDSDASSQGNSDSCQLEAMSQEGEDAEEEGGEEEEDEEGGEQDSEYSDESSDSSSSDEDDLDLTLQRELAAGGNKAASEEREVEQEEKEAGSDGGEREGDLEDEEDDEDDEDDDEEGEDEDEHDHVEGELLEMPPPSGSTVEVLFGDDCWYQAIVLHTAGVKARVSWLQLSNQNSVLDFERRFVRLAKTEG